MAIESNLHTRAVQQSLTPNIAKFHKPMEDELSWALWKYTKNVLGSHSTTDANSNLWYTTDIEDLILNLIAHISARIFVGLPLCRNEDWLRINKACTVNVFEVALTMRGVPRILKPLFPLIARMIPGWWRLQENINTAKRLAVPLVNNHAASKANGTKEPSMDLLSWMVDAALNPSEADPAKIAHRQILLGMGAIYTTKLALVNICYDYCTYPEYLDELREEVEQCLIKSGSWDKVTLDNMVKLEAFMSESQRLNPPNLSMRMS
jgi:cytochrome P450